MILYFLRHASAGDSVNDPIKDAKRPLDAEGILQSRYVGQALAALDTTLDVVISSPLKRATQTASIVANEVGYEGKIEMDPALQPAANHEQFLQMLRRFASADSVMVVGHNPNLSEFLSKTIGGGSRNVQVDLKKGAIAKTELRRTSGTLHWCVTPKLIRAVHNISMDSSRPKTSRK